MLLRIIISYHTISKQAPDCNTDSGAQITVPFCLNFNNIREINKMLRGTISYRKRQHKPVKYTFYVIKYLLTSPD